MRRTTLILAVILAALAAACGGADDDAEDTAADVDADATAEADVDSDDGEVAADLDAEVSGSIDAAACQEAADTLNAIPTAVAEATAGNADAAAIAAEANAFAELAGEVPDEYAADFQVLADAFTEIAATMENVDLQPGEAPDAEAQAALGELSTTLSSDELTTASTNVGEYFAAGCPQ